MMNNASSGRTSVSGELKTWHKVSIDFMTPKNFKETASTFRDYRLDVTFTNQSTGQVITVPGFFAADGDAANTSATEGNVWRVNFNPPSVGDWTYEASFRTGKDIAASANPNAGAAVNFINGEGGVLKIAPTDKTGEDFRAKGMILQGEGTHYLQHQGDGDYFIKGGPGVPENFLANKDIDNTLKGRHDYSSHAGDYNPGSPEWGNGKGHNLIGAVDYLAEQGQNSIYLLTNTAGGDGRDVWPWASERFGNVGTHKGNIQSSGLSVDDFSTYDVSKLAQWEIVFDHMDEQGIYKNLLFQETENDQLLNGGTPVQGSSLSAERLIYMREMIARFGHANGIQWNMGEENTNTNQERKDMAEYIKAVDPYDHLTVIHTFPNEIDKVYQPLLGVEAFDGTSFQTGGWTVRETMRKYLEQSERAGDPWVVGWDEDSSNRGIFKPYGNNPDDKNEADQRQAMWGTLTVGGSGVNWYIKQSSGHSYDQNVDTFDAFESVWKWTAAATDFFNTHIPFWEMSEADNLTQNGNDYVMAKEGEYYVAYMPYGQANNVEINLNGQGGETFDVFWYNPREGGDLISSGQVDGGSVKQIGGPPQQASKDWVLFVRNSKLSDTISTPAPSPLPSPSPVPTPDPTPSPVPVPGPNRSITIEAEDMQLSGEYRVESINAASGDKVISLRGGATEGSGAAKFNFNGPAGEYNVKIHYFDESDGMGQLKLKQGDQQIASFNLDKNLGSALADSKTLTNTEIKGLSIKAGEAFTLEGLEDGTATTAEHVRIDKIEFTPVNVGGKPSPTPAPSPVPTPAPAPVPPSNNGSKVYLAEKGQVVIEAENTQLQGDWKKVAVGGKQSVVWDANTNSYGGPSKEQTLSYSFKTDEAGKYSIAMHSARLKSAMNASDQGRSDTGNDIFVSVIDEQTGKVLQKPTKLYTNLGGSDGELRWGETFDVNHNHSPAQVDLKANTQYRLEVAGRSDGYVLDRITVSNDGFLKNAAIAESKAIGNSPSPSPAPTPDPTPNPNPNPNPAPDPMAVNIQTVKEAGISRRAVDYIYNVIDPDQRKAVLADETFKDTINAIRGTDSVPTNAIEITKANQASIAQIENGQGKTFVLRGNLNFGKTLNIPSGATIYVDGAITMNGNHSASFYDDENTGNSVDAVFRVDDKSNVKLIGVNNAKLIGNQRSTGVYIEGSSNVEVRGFDIGNVWEGVVAHWGSKDVKILNNYIHDTGKRAIWSLGSEGVQAAHNFIENAGGDAFDWDAYSNGSVAYENVAVGWRRWAGFVEEGAQNSYFAKNIGIMAEFEYMHPDPDKIPDKGYTMGFADNGTTAKISRPTKDNYFIGNSMWKPSSYTRKASGGAYFSKRNQGGKGQTYFWGNTGNVGFANGSNNNTPDSSENPQDIWYKANIKPTVAPGQSTLDKFEASLSYTGGNPAPNPNPSPNQPITVEAESMQLSGEYRVESINAASGDKVISLRGGATEGAGAAKFNFNGPAGKYDVKIHYFDENDGMGQMKLKQGNQQIASFNLDKQLGSALADAKTLTTAGIQGVSIKAGDTFTLEGLEDGTATTAEHVRIDKIEFTPVANTIRLNAGGGAFTDGNGKQWSADTFAQGGNTYSTAVGIDGTVDDPLFQTERFGKQLDYDIPVANGDYTVNLSFAEIYWNQANQRVFDVKAEDKLVLDNFDIHAGAGGKNIAVEKSFGVNVQDGVLNLDLTASVNNAKISGIEIIPV